MFALYWHSVTDPLSTQPSDTKPQDPNRHKDVEDKKTTTPIGRHVDRTVDSAVPCPNNGCLRLRCVDKAEGPVRFRVKPVSCDHKERLRDVTRPDCECITKRKIE